MKLRVSPVMLPLDWAVHLALRSISISSWTGMTCCNLQWQIVPILLNLNFSCPSRLSIERWRFQLDQLLSTQMQPRLGDNEACTVGKDLAWCTILKTTFTEIASDLSDRICKNKIEAVNKTVEFTYWNTWNVSKSIMTK